MYKHCENLIEKINNASPELLFRIVIIGIILSTLLIRAGLTTNVLLSFIIVGLISFGLLTQGIMKEKEHEKKCDEKLEKLNKQMNKKYNKIFSQVNHSVLYMNPALVKVFISMCPFARFDTRNFKEALVAANQLIRVYESAKLGQKLPNQTIDIAEALQRSVLNHMQSIIHSFPSTVIADYRFQVDINILQKILQKIIDNIHLIYQEDYEKNGPNIYNPPPSIRSGPWSNPLYTKEYNKNWNFYY